MSGKHGTGALVTLAERKSRLYLVRRAQGDRESTGGGILLCASALVLGAWAKRELQWITAAVHPERHGPEAPQVPRVQAA